MFRAETWMLTTLFAVGIIAGMTWLNLTRDAALSETDAAAAEVELRAKETNEGPIDFSTSLTSELNEEDQAFIRSNLQQGDRYLLAGNYERALKHYDDFGKTISSGETTILLREALCYELLGQYRQAGSKFYRSITSADNNNQLVLAISGFARCLFSDGKHSEALEILADQSLKLGQYTNVPAQTRAGLVYQYARVLEHLAISGEQQDSDELKQPVDLTAPRAIVFAHAQPVPEMFLSVIDEPCDPAKPVDSSPHKIVVHVLQRPADAASVITVSVQANLQSVLVLLGQLAGDAELELTMSPAAKAALQNRSRSVQLESISLSSLLDALLVPFGLAWQQTGREIRVVSQIEFANATSNTGAVDLNKGISQATDVSAADLFRFDVAERALRRFELDFQDSDLRYPALLSRGNLGMILNQYDVAANHYQELELARPKGEILAKLFFNQAKLQMQLGRHEEAVRLLYLAVDQTVDADVEASSYCLISTSLLATPNTDKVITAARRGISTAINNQQTRLATLNMSRAYLLEQDPFSANDSLFRARDAFATSKDGDPEIAKLKDIASLLGAYARFKGVSDVRGIQAERNRMLSAVAMIPDSTYRSFVECYIAAQAYRQLGFADKAAEKMLLALSRPDIGHWQRQILFELGMIQQESNQAQLATKTFQLLINVKDSWRLLSLQQLAQLHASAGNVGACISTCKQLWQSDLSEDQKRAALVLLGQAYQLRGEHHTAALCFAGILPDAL